MGLFYVGCRVLNPVTSKSVAVRRLMVDTGAESTWINATVLEAIGIERRKKDLQSQLANGQIITRSVGYAVLTVDKSETVDEVVFCRNRRSPTARRARSGRSESASGCSPEKAGGRRSDRQCSRRTSAFRTVGAGASRGAEDSRKDPDEDAQKASGRKNRASLNRVIFPGLLAAFHRNWAHAATYARFKGKAHHIWTGDRHSRFATLVKE